jgi:hypothetical protein
MAPPRRSPFEHRSSSRPTTTLDPSTKNSHSRLGLAKVWLKIRENPETTVNDRDRHRPVDRPKNKGTTRICVIPLMLRRQDSNL